MHANSTPIPMEEARCGSFFAGNEASNSIWYQPPNSFSSGMATLIYIDGSTQTFTAGFADWTTSPMPSLPNNMVATTMSSINTLTGSMTISISLFETEASTPTGKMLQSVILPTAVTPEHLHVFSIGTRGGPYNNARHQRRCPSVLRQL